MYRLKSVPEDFVVDEITLIREQESSARLRWKEKMKTLRGADPSSGMKSKETKRYTIFRMKKTGMDHFQAIAILSEKTRIQRSDFGYAGTKDRRAVTSQLISIPRIPRETLERLSIKGIEISDIFESDKPIKLGDLVGNRFHITVRNVEEKERPLVLKNLKKVKEKGFTNLFGEQRFGSMRSANHIIGKAIIKRDFEKAVMIFLTQAGSESGENETARARLAKEKDFRRALAYFARSLTYERIMLEHLSVNPDDFPGALRALPKLLGRMFIHAYQSHIWNEVAEKIGKDGMIPILGSKTILDNYPESKEILRKIMIGEAIKPSDFVIKDMMFLTTRGEERAAIVKPNDLKHSFGDDELNRGKIKLILDFELPKGSYATVLVGNIMNG
jgi:tRNA pseudouridine13 synthase